MTLQRITGPMRAPALLLLLLGTLLISAAPIRAEVILQWFETEWDDIYRRLPEVAEIGYEGIWHPSPTKSPVAGVFPNGGGGNVGYNLFDRFDLGDRPQRGTLATRYGTRGSLRNLVDNAHQTDIKIYPDIVFNHSGNGPHIDSYPGMRYFDFHGHDDATQPLGFRRTPRMSDFTPDSGDCDANFQQELVSLFDIQTEPDRRFSSDVNTCGTSMVNPGFFVRQPGQFDLYPFHDVGDPLPAEFPVDFLNRWINWLGYATDYDGARLDAPKHVVREFFGEPGFGFNHEIQWNFDDRRGFSDPNEFDEMYVPHIRRDDALIFAEMFIGSKDEVGYWRDWNGGQGPDNAQGVKMRYLDFPLLKQMMEGAFINGNMASLSGFGAFGEKEGVTFVHSHDEDRIFKKDLAYAYALTHIGVPIVYFTGNNYDPNDQGNRNWLRIGYESALGDWGNGAVPNLVYIHNQFARGNEWKRWDDGDVYIFERFEDLDADGITFPPDAGEGLLLVGLNDSGVDQQRQVDVGFTPGTVLHDYTGNNPTDITVFDDGGVSKVDITIPGMNGQGFVCYAPFNASADGDPLRFNNSGAPAPLMDWIVPGGERVPDKPRTVTRLTNDTVEIDVHFTEPLGAPLETVSNVIIKWGQGADLDGDDIDDDPNGKSLVSGGFEGASEVSSGHWRLTADLSGVSEGLHLVKARAFNGRVGKPALFQTFHEVVYVDRSGPDLDIVNLSEGETVDGDRVVEISNPDKTAGEVEARIDGGAWQPTHEIMKGTWKFTIQGLSPGAHSIEFRAREFDYGDPRTEIRTSTLTRNFTVADTSGLTLTMNHAPGAAILLPFFKTSGNVGSGTLTLLWNGYELANVNVNGGNYEHFFTGAYVAGGQTNTFWGAFVNGPHFIEAILDDGSGNVKVVSRTVFFNLYNKANDADDWALAYDSDGDGLPDEIEAPGFTPGDWPGPNVQWPGDANWDMIPNNGEDWGLGQSWGRLNPMNHDTFYNGTWDGDEDWDNDGFPNLCEVVQGFLLHDDPAHYNIYDPASHPDTCNTGPIAPVVSWSPTNPQRCEETSLTINYTPNEGPLEGISPIFIGVQGEGVFEMSPAGGSWQHVDNLETDETSVVFWFQDNLTTPTNVDNNAGANYEVAVGECVEAVSLFTMDGVVDSDHYLIHGADMQIWAAVKNQNLYFATWSANGGDSDHFLFVSDEIGAPENAPWAKAGQIWFNKTTDPYLVSESDPVDGFHSLNNGGVSGRSEMGGNGQVLEGEINLVELFGEMPDLLYIAAVAYGDNDGDGINSQGPFQFNAANHSGDNLELTEFLPVPVESIKDENMDGYFDCGQPVLETEVNGNRRDANYDLRRFFIDELAGDTAFITFHFTLSNVAPGDAITDVELLTNLNRRDFAMLEFDLDDVTVNTQNHYFRAYPMTEAGGTWSVTLPINKCGAYRATVRYKVNGVTYHYTDFGLRRDPAIVVSPKKVLCRTMYELNPAIIEATTSDFFGRSTFSDMVTVNTDRVDVVNTGHFPALGVNLVWLQPMHPVGSEGRQTDPETGQPFDPGSPFAIRNFWQVHSVLGDPSTPEQALSEFQDFVANMDATDVDVMMDAPFNHSAWDCQIGEVGVDLFPWATDPTAAIRDIRPEWYSNKNDYGNRATTFQTTQLTDIGAAPDRFDFGKWNDVADFHFGKYDALVQGQTDRWRDQYLSERDFFEGHDAFSQEIWQYFAEYTLFWLEQTGHPAGTPKEQSHLGIDGLRCDFAQGMPALFWEYIINKTRSVKWDFYFMAESLDGFATTSDGNIRHGLSYRSARHFDIMNENILFYWRDSFFGYPANGPGTGNAGNPTTFPTFDAYDQRRNAYDNAVLLNALTTHDEVFPSDNPYRLAYAYAEMAALDGIPLLMYGMEAGAQNDVVTYGFTGGIANDDHNWDKYELNFGKGIPNFKRYNHMQNVWANRDFNLQELYGRINKAKLDSPALKSQENFFLNRLDNGSFDDNLFAVARFQEAGVSAATQDVVFVIINNNFEAQANRAQTFDVGAEVSPGVNWFGIDPTHNYTVVDLIATNPPFQIWDPPRTGQDVIDNGVFVQLPYNQDQHGHFLKLVDLTDPGPGDHDGDGLNDWQDPDDDNDGLPDDYETANGLDPLDATGDNGAAGDKDGDRMSNAAERAAGTDPDDRDDVLQVDIQLNSPGVEVIWDTVPDVNYMLQSRENLVGNPDDWNTTFFGTATGNANTIADTDPNAPTKSFRIEVKP